MTHFPQELLFLIAHLRKLPGVGKKTAERYAFQLLNWGNQELQEFGAVLAMLKEKIKPCESCGCLMDGGDCRFCNHPSRDPTQLCLIASARDAYSIEETGAFKGLYHVLGSLLSPLEGKTPDSLHLETLEKRIHEHGVKEILLALDSTLEGDATSLYLKEQFERLGLEVYRLAFGLPMGSTLDYVDEGTLTQALSGKRKF